MENHLIRDAIAPMPSEPWPSDDDTPLDQDDQSWRDLTDDDIAAIRAIPDPSDHAAR